MLHTPPIHMYFVLSFKLVYNYKTRSKSTKWSTNNRKLYGKTKISSWAINAYQKSGIRRRNKLMIQVRYALVQVSKKNKITIIWYSLQQISIVIAALFLIFVGFWKKMPKIWWSQVLQIRIVIYSSSFSPRFHFNVSISSLLQLGLFVLNYLNVYFYLRRNHSNKEGNKRDAVLLVVCVGSNLQLVISWVSCIEQHALCKPITITTDEIYTRLLHQCVCFIWSILPSDVAKCPWTNQHEQ